MNTSFSLPTIISTPRSPNNLTTITSAPYTYTTTLSLRISVPASTPPSTTTTTTPSIPQIPITRPPPNVPAPEPTLYPLTTNSANCPQNDQNIYIPPAGGAYTILCSINFAASPEFDLLTPISRSLSECLHMCSLFNFDVPLRPCLGANYDAGLMRCFLKNRLDNRTRDSGLDSGVLVGPVNMETKPPPGITASSVLPWGLPDEGLYGW